MDWIPAANERIPTGRSNIRDEYPADNRWMPAGWSRLLDSISGDGDVYRPLAEGAHPIHRVLSWVSNSV